MKTQKLNLKKVKVVIFDFDDTIYNISSWAKWGPYVKTMLAEILGSEKKADDFVARNGISFQTNGQQIAVALIKEIGSAKKMVDYLSKNIFNIWDGTKLKYLKNEDFDAIRGKYKLYVLSNSPTAYTLFHLKKMGIDSSIFDGIYQNDFEPQNPTKQMVYAKILKHEKISPDEAIMIGDSYPNDIVPALTMGMQGAWINDLDDVKNLIKKLGK